MRAAQEDPLRRPRGCLSVAREGCLRLFLEVGPRVAGDVDDDLVDRASGERPRRFAGVVASENLPGWVLIFASPTFSASM